MKWDDKYPKAQYMDEPQPCIAKGRDPKPCWQCGTPTPWFELNYGSYLCSEECLDKVDRDYIRATHGRLAASVWYALIRFKRWRESLCRG